MKFVPFTVHIKVTPARPGKRVEYLRGLQKLAVIAQDAIEGVSGANPASPGGGQFSSGADMNVRGGLGGFANGTAIKPQMGNTPAQLTLTGFYESSAENIQTHSSQQRISGGEIYTGYAAHSNDSVPVATVNTEVKALKTALESALTANFPAGTDYEIFRLDYAGVIYGDRGYHFPL